MSRDRNLKKYFDEVGVSKGATKKEITKAYRKKALKVHPDRHLSQPKKYTELFKKLTRAHNVLTGTERPTPARRTPTPKRRSPTPKGWNWSPPGQRKQWSPPNFDDAWEPPQQNEEDIDEDEEFVYVSTPPKKQKAKKPKAKKPKAKKASFKKKTNTASVCLDFKLDSGINPRTGRKIKKGGPTYTKLKKECAQ